MAANSIAKLAVLITGDASPLQAGMQKAENATKAFDSEVARSRESLSRFSRMFVSASGGMGRFGGAAGALGAAGGPLGLAAVGMIAATVAAGRFALAIAKSNDAAQDLKIQSWRDYADAFEKLNGVKLTGHIGELEKTSEAWAELRKKAQEYFVEPSGLSTGGIAGWFNSFIDSHTPGVLRMSMMDTRRDDKVRDEQTKEMIEQAKAQVELEKLLGQQAAERIQAQGKAFEEMGKRAAAIIEATKTPAENFDDKLDELLKLSQMGAIGDETFERAFRQIQQAYQDATKKITDTGGNRSVGAVERFTAAGFSAVMRSSEQKKLEEAAKATAKNTEGANKLLASIAQSVQNRPGMDLAVSNF